MPIILSGSLQKYIYDIGYHQYNYNWKQPYEYIEENHCQHQSHQYE
jgi:hypothetical protein